MTLQPAASIRVNRVAVGRRQYKHTLHGCLLHHIGCRDRGSAAGPRHLLTNDELVRMYGNLTDVPSKLK
jgi:hypothetical protein